MKNYRTTVDTDLRAAPSVTAASLRRVVRGTEFAGQIDAGGLFIATSAFGPHQGFVDLFDVLELGEAALKTMMESDHDTFCVLVTEAARHVGWLRGTGADRDYLLAVAYAESRNLTDMGTVQDAGPFRFTAAEWQAAIQGPARELEQSPDNRLDWNHQPDVAAALAAEAAENFTRNFDRPPSFPELLFLQRLGPVGIDVLKRPREEACSQAIPGTPPAGSYAAALKQSTQTVKQAIGELEQRLVTAYAAALPVIDRQPPEIRLVRPQGLEPPWLQIARDEMTRGVAERPGLANEDRISRYHDSAGVEDKRDETPWCGSFVTFCLKTCGDAAAEASIPASPALAESWDGWGRAANDVPPQGSVVVLRFPDGGRHVGFLTGIPNDTHLRVLGGNQGDPGQISEVHFPKGQVTSIRWLDRAGAPAPAGETAPTAAADPRPGDELFIEKAPIVMRRLMHDLVGLTKIQAAAILGNIGHECMGFKALHQIGMPKGQGGHGWCQWDGSRREAFLTFAKKQGRDWHEDEVNYAFLVQELRGAEQKALASLLKQTKLDAAVEDFDRRFERSGVRALDRRLRYANLAFAAESALG
jgi:uncharacterized protein (TIGR02594 family)